MTYSYTDLKKRGPSAAVLKYDAQSTMGPEVVAQGHGRVAKELIRLAKDNNVHMEENAGLLAELLSIDLGEQVPPQLYQVIAEVLLLIEEMEKNHS
ncbi:EscU/YscU/HrcU family type III secretion system export apparatus switch protein [Aureibacillus halotolerans]|uniref:Flagellar biosynthesis protein n=1 Tax=Aureibacillus halotolerans TaxID=1508390 RepID=A0A4R6TYD7_9BACI|nr:EscU/YscU/HrcU family type III secretion system export apparatus switch protein [Aureibacillus halotolerans]TDQ36935.1 flagellar biosynthesis protein [Aureibacillus halotolerans]